MTLNEIPAWNEIESQPWFAALTPEEKQQSLQKWQGTMMQFASDPKEKFAVAATAKAKARSFFGEEMPDDPIADALQRRQKDIGDIGSRYDAFSKGQLEEDDEEVLTLNDTLKGNTPYSVIKGRLFVSPSLVWDKAAYEKVVNEAPVDEDERVLAMSAYDGSKERAAEGVVNSLGYTDEAFRDFAAKGFKEGKSNAAILDEWKANNKLPDGILGSLRGVGRQAYFGLRSGLSGLERAMGGLGGFFGSESAQKYAEESGKEAQSYMQRTLGEGPEFIGELTSGAVSIIPTMAAGAAASLFTEGAALPAAASITAGAIQSAGATQAETYEFYRNQGLDHANALAESRVDGLVSGLITGAITHYAGKLGDKIGLGKGIEGLFSGPASKIASKLTQREISESLKAGAKAVGGSFLQEGSEELLDQAAQDAYSMIKRDPTLTLAEAINNALQAGKVGAVLGGAAEAGKIGLKSLLNSAKFAVPTTEEEEALRAKFEVPATVEEEVIASPEVQQEEQNIKTAADVVKEAAPVAPQTAAVLAGITEEKAGELAADVVVKTGDALATIEAEAPLVVDETPLVLPASETAPISETPAVTTAPLAPIPTEETQQPQPVETPTNALPISPATPSLPREERPEMGLQQVGEGNAQPEKVAETRPEEEVSQDRQKFLSDLQFYGTARLGDNTFAIKQASDDSFYIEKTTGGQRSTVASGFPDIEAAQRGAAELVTPTPEEVASTGQPPTLVEEALPERGASVETIASGGGMSVEEARQFLARRSDSGEPLIFGRPFSEISGMQQNERPRVLQASDKLRAVKQVVGDINKFRIPVSQEVVNAYGITLPSGYVKQGDLYVFQTPSPPTTGAVPTKTLPAGQEVTPGGVASPGVAAEAAPQPAPEAQPEQPATKKETPTEPSESTLSIAKRFGGRIAWSQGDLAIIEGFQLFGSKSLYVAVVGDRYSLTDFTLMKPEQRKALLGDNEELFLRKREEIVEANNRMLAQNPDGPFTNGQTVVVSKNVPQNVASVFREWIRLLGLSAPTRIVLTTPQDGIDMAAEYGGKFRRIGVTSLMSDNERGQMTPLGEDDFHIFYKEDTSYARTLEVLAHELGHILERQSFKNLPDDQRKAIIAEHEKWLKRVGSQKALDGIRELRAMRVGRIQPNVDRADDRFDSLNAYWKSFSEWFADQVARWATTTDKPLTVIEKFFARLGKKLREFFNLKGSQFAPNQRIADWLNSLSPDLNAVVEETLAPAETATKDSLPVVARDTSKPEQRTPLEYMRKAVGAKFVESVAPGKEEAWWSAKEKQEAPRRYAAGTKMVLEENGRFFVLDLNTNKYKGFGSKREAFLFFKAKDGRWERRYIEVLSGKKLDPLSRIDHKIAVDNAVKNNAPVSAEAVDAYGIKLPEGYVKQGELYVYEKTQPLPKGDAAGERGAVAAAPTVEPAPEARPVSQPVQAFRDAVSQMSPTAQAKWTPELRATAEAYLDSGGTTGLQGLSDVQQKVVGRFLPEEVKAAFDAEDARKRAQRNKLPDHRESSLPPTPGKQIRKIGKGAMGSVPAVLDEIAKVIPNIRELVEVRESVEGEPDAEGFYDPQADKAVVLVDNVYLKPQHGGSQEAALRETIIHELLHRGFAKLRQTNPQLFEQFEAFSLADTNDAQFEALVRRGYSMYSNWKDDPAQNQKAREEIFIRKAVVDLNFKGIEAIKSPTSLASQFFSWLRGLLNKLLGRKVDDEALLHWSRVFLNAAQADFIEKTPGERSFSMGRDLLSPEKYARHAELEAKHNAGTITPEETAEAQALVEEAAKAAGYGTKAQHKTSADFTVFARDAAKVYRKNDPDGFYFSPVDTVGYRGRKRLLVFLPTNLRDISGEMANGQKSGMTFSQSKQAAMLNALNAGAIGTKHDGGEMNSPEFYVSDPSQIKSADPFTGVRLEQRFGPSPDIRYSLADKDAEYLDAVEAGDMEKAQRMVDEAAKAAGFNIGPVPHGTTAGPFNEFRTPAYFGSGASMYAQADSEIVSWEGPRVRVRQISPSQIEDNLDSVTAPQGFTFDELYEGKANGRFVSFGNDGIYRFDGVDEEGDLLYSLVENLTPVRDDSFNIVGVEEAPPPSEFPRIIRAYLKMSNPAELGAKEGSRLAKGPNGAWDQALYDNLVAAGHDGVIADDDWGGPWNKHYIVFRPEQVKSADPVTYDDAGNVIPPSQRFQTVSPDIRYSLGEPPDMQAEADALREVTPSSQALDKFRETFGTPRQDVGQVLGKKEGSVYTQAQVAPLIEYARSMIGFENDANGDPIISPEATQKALNMVANLNGRPGFASQFNVRAAEVFKGKPVDPEIATAVLTQELQVYANRLSASSPKAEDQILKVALTPFYNTQILGSYLSRRIAGRTLQAASMASGETGDARKSREEAEKAVNKEITKQLGDEAFPAAEGMDKAGVEGGVDAIKDDIPAPADPTLRLLDLAVESLDEVAKAKTERVFDILFEIGQLEELVAQDEKVGNKAMSILRNPNLAARNYPTDPAERKALLAQKKAELATALDEALASLQGAKPETRKKVKAKAAKTKSKTDSVQKLIDKLSKMPDESKEAKPKAETLRAAVADAIKEKEFDEQKVRDAAAKFGATPEQTERLVEEAERIHEIRQSPKLSKAKLRQFLLSFPKNVLANPEQREALLRSFLKGQNYSEAEINRIVPQVLRDFDTGYQKARKAYLDELEKKLKPKQGQKESKQDQQNRKMLNALRSGLADTTSEASVALAKSLGFEAFRPQDDHILSKLDEEMRKLREQGRLSDSNAKFDAIKSLLIRRRPPRGFGEVVAQSWITSALSSLSNLAVNVWAPMGEAGVRLMSDIVRATALGKFDEIPLYFEAAGKAMKGTLSRFNFAVKTDTFTNSVNTLIAGMASMKDEMQRSAAVLKDKNASPAAKANAGLRYAMSFGDYSRRILSSIDDTWYTALSSYVGSSNLIKLLGDAKMPKKAVEAIVFHANNDALNQARAEYETLQAVEQFIEAMRGKTNEEIDAGFEYLGLNDASVTKEQANYIQELVSAFQSLRLRSGATGDELIKRALKELRNFRASVSVRATELGQMRTKELVREALSDTQTPAQVEEAIKEFDENAKKAASFGMGLHRVEGVPPYDILGNMFGIVDAMGRQAVQKSPLLGRMIVGFFGIPLNLLNRAVWFTPYGLGRYFLAKWQMAKNPEEKFYEYSMASQRERTMRFTEAAVGTSMTMLLYALGVARDSDDKEDEGFYITLGGPSNKTEYDAWYARGFRKFSICYKTKSGSVVSVPYGRGTGEVLKGPLMLLGAFDDMRLNKKLGDREDMSSVIEYLNAAAAGIGKQATFLGAKNTAGAFFSEQFGTSTASNLAYSAANLIPFNGLDRSISALALGPPDRSRTGAIWANIPIVRHLAHQPAINVFGDPWGNKSESALNQLWDRQWNLGLLPLNISAPLTGNQKRLYNFIGERLMGPSDPLRGALELRNGYLTDEEFYRYKQYRGKQMAQTWLTDLDRWRKLDDDSLSKAIAELSTKATKKAKDRFNYK